MEKSSRVTVTRASRTRVVAGPSAQPAMTRAATTSGRADIGRRRSMEAGDCSVCCAPLMRLPAPAKLLALPLCAAALAIAGCGEQGNQLAQDDPLREGAELFEANCSGCHTLSVAGTQGSASQ